MDELIADLLRRRIATAERILADEEQACRPPDRADRMRCWQCGVEPTGTVDVRTFGDPGPVLLPTGWPPGDHEHAVTPPGPGELAERGDRVAARILAIAAE